MLIAIVSDSHCNRESIERVKKKISVADVLLFLGDGERDLRDICDGFKGDVYAVRGNCDISGLYPEEQVIELGDRKIFMCHGHRYGVKLGYNSIFYRGKELGADIVLFGHSHLPIIEHEAGMILMNPGSISHGYGRVDKTLGYIDLVGENEPIAYIEEL